VNESAARANLTRRQTTIAAGLVGVASALVTFAVAEVVSVMLGEIGDPFNAVGSLIIDLLPPGGKEVAVSLFGTNDKLALFVALGLVVLILAYLVGLLQVRRPPWGIVAMIVVGAIAVGAVVTRAEATAVSVSPTILGFIAGIWTLGVLVRRLDAWRRAEAQPVPPPRSVAAVAAQQARNPEAPNQQAGRSAAQYERRSFFTAVIATGLVSAVIGAGARTISAAATAVGDLRSSLKLPVATSAAPILTAGDTLTVPGISPFISPNADFYRIDTALQVPSIDPTSWRLKIVGMVKNEVEISYADLIALPLEERLITLTCVSNEVGGNLIGNASWLGYPIRELLARAQPTAGADMVLSTSQDGFTAGTPLSVLQDPGTDALLAVGMNGDPLPVEHGFPVRMVVPGLYGYVSATKWVVELKVTTFARDMGYWVPRGWSAKGPIKLSSRIDTPITGDTVKAGTVAVAGVAWAQHVGISRVDVRIDEGGWQPAKLAMAVTADSWLQWSYAWAATSGSHVIQVRATDANGLVQTSIIEPPAPNGASGYHTISVQVS
jgi:DMSO/TMAO reductase YedYZ molybdopterin-dependent catalytic subunit